MVGDDEWLVYECSMLRSSLRCDESWDAGLAEVGACIQWVGQIESAETKRGNPPRLRCATKPFEDWAMNVLIYESGVIIWCH